VEQVTPSNGAYDIAVEAAEHIAARTWDAEAATMVGGVVGRFVIADRVKPGKRWLYVLRDLDRDEIRHLRGEEVVRLARTARLSGLAVVMPCTPWRDENGRNGRSVVTT
jgi:hypothetical protein